MSLGNSDPPDFSLSGSVRLVYLLCVDKIYSMRINVYVCVNLYMSIYIYIQHIFIYIGRPWSAPGGKPIQLSSRTPELLPRLFPDAPAPIDSVAGSAEKTTRGFKAPGNHEEKVVTQTTGGKKGPPLWEKTKRTRQHNHFRPNSL